MQNVRPSVEMHPCPGTVWPLRHCDFYKLRKKHLAMKRRRREELRTTLGGNDNLQSMT